MPDVATFPRSAWLRCLKDALASITDADLDYGDPCGLAAVRRALADYLGRVRGVVADPERVIVTCGFSQSNDLICRALAQSGARRIAYEDPSNPDPRRVAERAGLQPVLIGVDEHGLRVDELERSRADAVVLTPAHHHPTGALLSGERRSELLAWLREHDALAVEDDYDAEYRYDRAAVGALQGLEPERVIYAGSVSKTLASALRIGWLVVPAAWRDAIAEEKQLADRGTARIEQQALAGFLESGALDRHLRRMRLRYRARRDALVDAVGAALPGARVRGIAAGLHVTVELPGCDEAAIHEEARRRRVELEVLGDYGRRAAGAPATLLLGYGRMPEATLRAGVAELAAAVGAAGAAV